MQLGSQVLHPIIMIYQQSLSEIESALSIWTPLQIVQQILRAKHEDDRLYNLYLKNYLQHFDPSSSSPLRNRAQDVFAFAYSQELLSKCYSLGEIMSTIKGTILQRTQSEQPHPFLASGFLNAVASLRKNKPGTPMFSAKKGSLHSASTGKSDNKDQLKKCAITTKEFTLVHKSRRKSSVSQMSKINHDLSRMINDVYGGPQGRKKVSLRIGKGKKAKNTAKSRSKDKNFRHKLSREKISPVGDPNPKQHDIDENYGLTLMRRKKGPSQERIKGNKNSLTKPVKALLDKFAHNQTGSLVKARSVDRGALSPMTPKPRLDMRDVEWHDYSQRNRESRKSQTSRANMNPNMSKSIEGKKGLVSPKSKGPGKNSMGLKRKH